MKKSSVQEKTTLHLKWLIKANSTQGENNLSRIKEIKEDKDHSHGVFLH